VRELTLYTKRNCPLCDEAQHLLARLGPELGFAVNEVDVETDAGLLRRYRYDVPVLALNGEVLLSAPLEEREVRGALAGRLAGRLAEGQD
jgi:glutaredoxin